jgi:hypothetical protein
MRQLDRSLAHWTERKYKKLRGHLRRAGHWVARISRRDRNYTGDCAIPSCGGTVFFYHRILPRGEAAGFNRRMRKTARPVVWEGARAQSPSLHPIVDACPTQCLDIMS